MTVLQAFKKRGVRPSIYQDRLGLGVSAIDGLLSRMKYAEKSGCWIWTGALVTGYGVVHMRKVRPSSYLLVHRLCFELAVGPIDDGHHVHHEVEKGCIGRACCNPDHVAPVTGGDHVRIHAAQRDTCRDGHPYTPENTFVTADGWRRCRECDLLRARLYREDKRLAEPGGRLKGKWHQDKLKTHCKYGHPLSGENAYYAKTKWGVFPKCRACQRRLNKESTERKRLQSAVVSQ